MNTSQFFKHQLLKHIRNAVVIFCAAIAPAHAAVTDLDNSPIGTSATINALPNVMVMLDDSGSMDWDYMPDNAGNFSGNYGFNSPHCNGVYYNPNITYTIPVDSTGTPLNNSAQTSFTTAYNDGYNTGAGTVNLNTQFPGGSGSGSSGAPNYSGPAFYYTYTGTQTAGWQMNYYNTSGTFYTECDSGTVPTSSGAPTVPPSTAPFTLTVMSSANPVTTIAVTNPSGGSPATITVGSSTSSSNAIGHVYVGSGTATQIWGKTTSPSSTASSGSSKTSTTIASYIARGINACTASIVSPCTVSGYSATCPGYPNCTSSVVTLTGPGSASGLSPSVSNSSGSITYTYTAFPTVTSTSVTHIMVGSTDLLSNIATASTTTNTTLAASIQTGITATGYSATISGNVVTITNTDSTHGASGLTPVITTSPAQGGSGVLTVTPGTFSTSSSGAQLQNFANWYSYYSHRMLMMKSGLGTAFSNSNLINADGTAKYRVGFMTMNNNVNPDFVDILPFVGGCAAGSGTCQKDKWYTKLYSSISSNSTPLREALSHVGQLYAHKFGTITSYTSTITINQPGSCTTSSPCPTGILSVTVNGTETMNCAYTGKACPIGATTSAVAANIANQINAMVQTDYGATASGNVVTITGILGSVGYTPVITDDGGAMTETATAFVASTSSAATLNGVTPLDPMQYSCQQNFVILSTDGFWNGPNTYDLNNNAVGQQDGNEPRPMNDGGSAATQTTTQILQSTSQTVQVQQAPATLQWTTNLQQATGALGWATNQQKTTSTLTWQTKNQILTGYLQTHASGSWVTVAANGTCSGTTSTCRLNANNSTTLTTPSATYLAYGATCTASGSFTSGTGGTQGSGGTVVSCPVSGSFSGTTSLTAGQTCTGGGNIQCGVTGSSGATYVTTYPGTCTATYNGTSGTSTADGTGKVTTCSTSGSYNPTLTSVGANGVCNGALANILCSNAGTASYVATYPPACTNTFNSASTSTADSSGNVTTCTTSGTLSTGTNTASSGSCTPGTNVQCQYHDGSWSPVSSCTTNLSSGTGAWTITSGTDCQTIPASCTAGTNGCNAVTTSNVPVASCTASSASSANSYTTTTCPTPLTVTIPSSSCVASSASSANNYTTTTCTAGSGGTPNTLADVAEYYYITDLRDSSLGNCTGAGTVGGVVYGPGGDVCYDNVPTSTLDTQKQQHMTTFTLGLGARGSMVFNSSYPNLTTSCTPANDGDFCSVLLGSTAAASTSPTTLPATCSWQTAGTTCNWPVPSSGSINNIDDLWHAAVNGRGTYFSATDPASLASGLASTLAGIQARIGSSASASLTNPNLSSAGNNYVFSTTYTSGDWTGDVKRQTIDLNTGSITCTGSPTCTPVIDWSAQAQLDTLAGQGQTTTTPGGGNRTIYTYNGAGTLQTFDTTHFTSSNSNFSTSHISGLSQYSGLSSANQTAAAGTNLVNYLRGDRNNEGTLYRVRSHILGDIVDSGATYVGAPMFNYGDANYASGATSYVSAKASRQGMVYVGANDGMLHAFYAASDSMDSNGIVSSGGTSVTGGAEAWAYIPALVLPNLYLLADKSYLTQHQFFVDGNPIVGDICPNAPSSTCTSTQWKTILVGGLNDGGSGYYALDVTNPASPQALWEFTDANMGKSYGNPQITKLGGTGSLAGTWVVLLTSGYNNTSGDGKGHLYVLNANTGALITSIGTGGIISTGVGSAGTPSGLARISARVQTPSADNTALEVYGGDLLGNVWRFDINNNVGSSYANYEAQLLVTLKDASGNPQPITSKPEIGIVSNQLVVFVGTGKLLGVSDLTNTQVQTMYGIMDPLTVSTTAIPGTAIYASPQSSGSTCTSTITTNCFVQQTAVDTTCPSGTPTSICATGTPVRTGSNNAVNFPAQSGWYINFPDSGERDNTDPALALGTLGFVTNTPSSANSCSVGGYSYYWFLNYATGAPLATSTTGVISNEINPSAPAFSSGPVFFTLPPGSAGSNSGGSGKVLISTSSGNTMTQSANFSGSGGSTRRTSWRELFLQ